jgi:hypothetical protein
MSLPRSSIGLFAALTAALTGTLLTRAVGAQTIDTGPPGAISPLTPVWLGGAYSRGQSFTVGPTLTTLESFGFYLSDLGAGGFPA